MRSHWLGTALLLGGVLAACGLARAGSNAGIPEDAIIVPSDTDSETVVIPVSCGVGCKVHVFRIGQGIVDITGMSPGGACPPTCSGEVPFGGSVLFFAQPLAGYSFAGWGGSCVGTNTSCGIGPVNGAVTVVAKFKKIR